MKCVFEVRGAGMEKRIRERIKRVEKLEIDLLSDEKLVAEKKEIMSLIEIIQNELLRRTIMMAAFFVSFVASLIGLLSYPSPPMLFLVLISFLILLVSVVQYAQKYRSYNDLFKAADILFKN